MRKFVLLLAIVAVSTLNTNAQYLPVIINVHSSESEPISSFGKSTHLGPFSETFPVNSLEFIQQAKEDLSEIKSLLTNNYLSGFITNNYEIGINFEYSKSIVDDKNHLIYFLLLDTQTPCIEISVGWLSNTNSGKKEITKNDRVYRFMYNSHLESYTFSPASIVRNNYKMHYEVDNEPEVGFDEFLKYIREFKYLVEKEKSE
jgi:hypothetical protein